MQRRRLLALVAGAGTVGAAGAATAAVTSPAGPPAGHADDPIPRARAWNRPVVTTDSTTAGDEAYGTVEQRASVLELDAPNTYALVAEYELTPGSNYRAGSGWRTSSLTVEHEWRSGASLVSRRGDVVPADGSDDDGNLYLETDRSAGRCRWDVTFGDATANARVYRFATACAFANAPEAGDVLLEATVGGTFAKGPLRASERDVASNRLAMPGAGG
ncbi:MAG: hypothetical protein ABEJ61_03940 [Haloferacaceae archaeon]